MNDNAPTLTQPILHGISSFYCCPCLGNPATSPGNLSFRQPLITVKCQICFKFNLHTKGKIFNVLEMDIIFQNRIFYGLFIYHQHRSFEKHFTDTHNEFTYVQEVCQVFENSDAYFIQILQEAVKHGNQIPGRVLFTDYYCQFMDGEGKSAPYLPL